MRYERIIQVVTKKNRPQISYLLFIKLSITTRSAKDQQKVNSCNYGPKLMMQLQENCLKM